MIRHLAEGQAWCFVLLSVALGTQFLSSYPSTSALPTRGRSNGTPSSLVLDLPMVQGATSSSSFPVAHTHDVGGSFDGWLPAALTYRCGRGLTGQLPLEEAWEGYVAQQMGPQWSFGRTLNVGKTQMGGSQRLESRDGKSWVEKSCLCGCGLIERVWFNNSAPLQG